jgi:ABC-type multidrug transport system fused ATPase/permease subunit
MTFDRQFSRALAGRNISTAKRTPEVVENTEPGGKELLSHNHQEMGTCDPCQEEISPLRNEPQKWLKTQNRVKRNYGWNPPNPTDLSPSHDRQEMMDTGKRFLSTRDVRLLFKKVAQRPPHLFSIPLAPNPLWDNDYLLDRITVHGARQHNLKNIDVEIPRNTFTVITGLSGSGKSSLAFDTIYAEGQRRYDETLSPYARQFLDQMERPEVDSIDGLSPAISSGASVGE